MTSDKDQTAPDALEPSALIEEAARLIAPGPGETCFWIRVGGERSVLQIKAAPGVEPAQALKLAVDVLLHEQRGVANCPAHSPAPQAAEPFAGTTFETRAEREDRERATEAAISESLEAIGAAMSERFGQPTAPQAADELVERLLMVANHPDAINRKLLRKAVAKLKEQEAENERLNKRVMHLTNFGKKMIMQAQTLRTQIREAEARADRAHDDAIRAAAYAGAEDHVLAAIRALKKGSDNG